MRSWRQHAHLNSFVPYRVLVRGGVPSHGCRGNPELPKIGLNKLVEPIFGFDREVIPAGTIALGRVSQTQGVEK